MKYLNYIAQTIILFLLTSSANAAVDYREVEGHSYFGVNYAHHFISPKNHVRGLFRKNQPGLNFYLGYDLDKIAAFEFGYSFTTRNTLSSTFVPGRSVHGIIATAPGSINAQIRHKSTNVDVKLFLNNILVNKMGKTKYLPAGLPVFSIAENRVNNSFYLSLGVGFVRPSVVVTVDPRNGTGIDPFGSITGKSSFVGRFGLGYEYYLSESYSLRAEAIYVTTERMQLRGTSFLNSRKLFKDGTIVSAGAIYRFF